MGKEEMEALRPKTVGEATGTILEIGFGSGLNLPFYKSVNELFALEPSQELINLAAARIKNVGFPVRHLNASAEQIPLPDGSIDTVVSTWCLCSIPHLNIALKEIARVLKPNGKFIFLEHGRSSKQFIALAQNIMTPISRRVGGGCCLNREIEILIREAGFEILEIKKFQQKKNFLDFVYQGIAIPVEKERYRK